MAVNAIIITGVTILVLSIIIYKGTRKLARDSSGRYKYTPRKHAEREVQERPVRSMPQEEEYVAAPPKKIVPSREPVKDPLRDYITSWEEPSPPVEKKVREVKKEKKKPVKKKVGRISPGKYPSCFGTDYFFEKCKKDCGLVEECTKAIEILDRM